MTDGAATLSRLLPAVAARLQKLLALLEVADPPAELADQKRAWTQLKQTVSRAGLAQRLELNEAELVKLERALQEAGRRAAEAQGSAIAQRNALIAALRLAGWLDRIAASRPELAAPWPLEPELGEDAARQRVRALELILRNLIDESYRNQQALVERLRALLKGELVERWLRAADPGDVLSGMAFSELASFFVSKQEFDRYAVYFADSEYLQLLRDRRRTLQEYLDGVRWIRNSIAHLKTISPVQLALLELYYEEVTGPVSEAFAAGKTQIDPAEYLETSVEELRAFSEGLAVDLREVEEDVGELQRAVEVTREKVSALEGSLVYLVAAIAIFVANIVYAVVDPPQWEAGNTDAYLEATGRLIRGFILAGATFLIAVGRISFNLLVANHGKAPGLVKLLRGGAGKLGIGIYAVAALLFFAIPSQIGVSDQLDDTMEKTSRILLEVNGATAAQKLDAVGLRAALDGGLDPSYEMGETSLLGFALTGTAMDDQHKPLPAEENEARRERVVELLLGRGAIVREAEIELAERHRRKRILPRLRAARAAATPE